MSRTEGQSKHTAKIRALLLDPMGTWISGKVLMDRTGTPVLSARIAAIRDEGYQVETRSVPGTDYLDYRIAGRGSPRGRTQVFLNLPPHPEGRGWTDEEAAGLKAQAQEAVAAFIASKYQPAPAKEDWIDFLLEAGQ
ncbi:MAG: hypothetical protein Q8P18_18300 [Pseudomonadota bacterium]|nr:hypothetical protein [Pseudomonadota bacterium]